LVAGRVVVEGSAAVVMAEAVMAVVMAVERVAAMVAGRVAVERAVAAMAVGRVVERVAAMVAVVAMAARGRVRAAP
jgi:hypothetical protein